MIIMVVMQYRNSFGNGNTLPSLPGRNRPGCNMTCRQRRGPARLHLLPCGSSQSYGYYR